MPCACGSAAVLHVATCGSTAELACVPISLTAPSPLPPPFEFGALSDIRWEHCCGSTAMHLCSEENTQSLLLMAVLPEDRQYVPPALEAPPQLCISSPCVGCLPCRRSWWADLRTDVTLHHIVRLHAARTRSLKIWVFPGAGKVPEHPPRRPSPAPRPPDSTDGPTPRKRHPFTHSCSELHGFPQVGHYHMFAAKKTTVAERVNFRLPSNSCSRAHVFSSPLRDSPCQQSSHVYNCTVRVAGSAIACLSSQ